MEKTDIELAAAANIVQNETTYRANTAVRIGQLFNDLIDSKINIDIIDTDGTLSANSDLLLASQKAIVTFVQSMITAQDVPAGTVDLWAGDAAALPGGWLLCSGQAVSRTVFSDLFTAVGTRHGVGDGTTTFNVPNIGKKIVAGYDAGDVDYNTVGGTGGNNSVTLTDQMIAHKHTYDKYVSDGGPVDGDNGPDDFSHVPTDTSSIGNTAIARDAVDLRNEYFVLPYKIKT